MCKKFQKLHIQLPKSSTAARFWGLRLFIGHKTKINNSNIITTEVVSNWKIAK